MARKRKARKIASKIHNLANQKRRERSLKTLDGHPPLNRAAERYARVVMDTGEFCHYADGRKPAERYKGYETRGENLHKSRNPDRSVATIAAEAIDGWMGSKGHRENLLRPDGRLDGVGVWIRSDTIIAAHVIAAGKASKTTQPRSLVERLLK